MISIFDFVLFISGVITGVIGLAVINSVIRKAIENGVKAEVAKWLSHAAAVASASAPKQEAAKQ